MDGSDDIVEKLEYVVQGPPHVDLYWGETIELLREALVEIKKLRKENEDDQRR